MFGSSAHAEIDLPASDVEGVVLERLRSLLSEPKSIADALLPLEPDAARLDRALRRAAALSGRWLSIPANEMRALVHEIVARVVLTPDRITMEIGTAGLAATLGINVTAADTPQQTILLSVAAALRRAGNRTLPAYRRRTQEVDALIASAYSLLTLKPRQCSGRARVVR